MVLESIKAIKLNTKNVIFENVIMLSISTVYMV